ncbi:hypothetical protein [Stagnihabitans tardus]|uniref:Uncharacterized protein n=1 Tax=Stagnihabitans tardus TaxID=2699202 RepID=A0AAE5BV12_9RHOB|nr:hypothetical protein [Stagnihabitans tardus]NBZ87319.1 hypothetical protein [Stagnihabitans tardus]
MRLAAALLVLLAAIVPGWAAPVVVTSGEHRDFTRVVLQFEGQPDWQFGRTLDGYAIRIPGARPDYDLARAFALIGKTRLATMGPDPATGDLALGIACACHAIAFEFRPGIVVIDLRDGAPPAGSSFEEPLPPLSAPPPAEVPVAEASQAETTPGPDAEALVGGYDWTRLSLEQLGISAGDPAAESLAEAAPAAPKPDLDHLRDSLVQELGMGATAGLIELAPPPRTETDLADPLGTDHAAPDHAPVDHAPVDHAPAEHAPAEHAPAEHAPAEHAPAEHAPAEVAAEHGTQTGHAEATKLAEHATISGASEAEIESMMRTHLGETPEIQMRDVGEARPALTAQGARCISDEDLDLPAWGGADRAIADQFGPIRQGMIGEFDKPSPEAIKRVIRFYLFIGFGAEARSLLRAYPDLFEEAPIWTAMAHLLDGEPDVTGTFSGMEDCDTAAALWAVLSDPKSMPRDEIGRAAVARSFSAMPAAIRRLIGPRLVDAYIAAGDIPTATALSTSVLRAPGDAGPEVVMMQAAMDRALGHVGEAEAKLEPLAHAPGPASTDALVDLVEHRAMLGQTVSEDEVITLEAALREREGSVDEERYRTALVLAKAASGNYDAAFAETEDPATLSSIWRLLAQAGGDTPLLNHATLAEGDPAPVEARESAGIIADRMLMLGLADQAARWLTLAPRAPDLLRARVALANGEAQAAIDLVRDDSSERAMHLKAQALISLGDQQGAAEIYAAMGQADQEMSILTANKAWEKLATQGPGPWKDVASIVTGIPSEVPAPPEPDPLLPDGPLAQNKRLVDESALTRDAITNLLNSVPVSDPLSQ